MIKADDPFRLEEEDDAMEDILLPECQDKEIIKSVENKDYHRLRQLEDEAENKDTFGRKVFRYWQATRICEMDDALKPFFTVAASVKSQEKFIEVKDLIKVKKSRVTCVAPTSALHRSTTLSATNKNAENPQCFKKLCFEFFSIESRQSQCWFHLEKTVENLEVRVYDPSDHENLDEVANDINNKKNRVILRAKKTKNQTFTLDVGCYNIDINGQIFFIEVLA